MFWLVLFVLTGILTGGLFWKGTRSRDDWPWVTGIFSCVLCVVALLILCIVNGAFHEDQIANFEEIRAGDKLKIVFKNKAEHLSQELSILLYEAYPEYEKDILKAIAKNKLLLFKYPEIKSSETIMLLANKVEGYWNDYYGELSQIQNKMANCRYRKQSIMPLQWMVPEIPEDVKQIASKIK